jgi:hypothetical protein
MSHHELLLGDPLTAAERQDSDFCHSCLTPDMKLNAFQQAGSADQSGYYPSTRIGRQSATFNELQNV